MFARELEEHDRARATVTRRLVEHAGSRREEVEKLRADKADEGGAFTKRFIWSGNRTDERDSPQ